MIVDTSALIAILRDEPEAGACARAIESSTFRRVSAGNFVEAAVIIDASRDPVASRRFDELIKEAEAAHSSGVASVLLFGIPETKDEQASAAAPVTKP